MEDLPGVQYIEGNIRNEALRRNTSVRIQWLEFEEDDNLRNERMRNLEPQARAGRLLISTATGRAAELRRQVLNFGLVLENGILDCISRLASKVPISMMRTDIDEEETERQMRRKADIANHFAFNQGGMQELEDRKRREAEAAAAAWQNINTGGLSDILGGLDG
jgi:hypothetical protein